MARYLVEQAHLDEIGISSTKQNGSREAAHRNGGEENGRQRFHRSCSFVLIYERIGLGESVSRLANPHIHRGILYLDPLCEILA